MKIWNCLIVGVLSMCVVTAPAAMAQERDEPARPADRDVRGGDTPQAVFDTFFRAGTAKDWRTMYHCMTEDTSGLLTVSMMFMPLFVLEMQLAFAEGDDRVEAEKNRDEFHKMLKSHGLDPQKIQETMGELQGEDREAQIAAARAIIAPVRDKAKLYGEVMNFFEKIGGDNPFSAEEGDKVEVKDIRIDGDNATGTIVSTRDGDVNEQPIEFRKVNGKWLIQFPLD